MNEQKAWNRCCTIAGHLIPSYKNERKWNGWGYKDTRLALDSNGNVFLSGNRYQNVFTDSRVMPELREWAERVLGLDLNKRSPSQSQYSHYPTSRLNSNFLKSISSASIYIATDNESRLSHAHGHTCLEIYKLRNKTLSRIPDAVIWPSTHSDVELIVKNASLHNICIIPYGGGTSVTNALECEENEKRMIVSLDMRRMCSIRWIDKDNMLACVEAGITGDELDRQMLLHGLVVGHQPDSSEFSTLGGWISTRASGLKKNAYGNIEDIIVNIRMVSPTGVLSKSFNISRCSVGPDLNQIILGSEGTLGVITEAIIRLRLPPEVVVYDSLLFPDFSTGVATLREIASLGCAPASIRLLDNIQFQFGQALKPQSSNPIQSFFLDRAKKYYITKFKGFSIKSLCAATLVFEGRKSDVELQRKYIYDIAKKHGAMPGGAENGKRGYFLTYLIAYLRDFAFDYYFMSESMETCVPWDKVQTLCRSIHDSINSTALEQHIPKPPLVCCRVTQTYDTSACVYIYFGFVYDGVKNPEVAFEAIEEAAVETIISCGASLSHHHGIGKHRRKWFPQAVSHVGIEVLKSIKNSVDPSNVFACGNMMKQET